jgi:hypothetical protein
MEGSPAHRRAGGTHLPRKWGDYEIDNHVVEYDADRFIAWESRAGRGHPNQGAGHGRDPRAARTALHELRLEEHSPLPCGRMEGPVGESRTTTPMQGRRTARVVAALCMAATSLTTGLAPESSAAEHTARTVSATSGRLPVFAAVVEGDNTAHLVVGHLRGDTRKVFTSDVEGGINDVAVSPSGKRVAFTEFRGDSKVQLDVVNVDGSGFRHLTVGLRSAWELHPVWSRDGDTVFFDHPYEPSDPTRSGYSRVWRVPADGSARPIRVDGASYVFPVSARNGGRWLALGSQRPESGYGRCAVMRVSGAHKHNVGPDNCADALWRPQSAELAISRVVHYSNRAGPTVQIWLLSLRTDHYQPVPHTQSPDSAGLALPLAWTANGDHIYFSHRSADGQHVHIYRMKADGSDKTDVTPSIPQRRTGDIAVQPA